MRIYEEEKQFHNALAARRTVKWPSKDFWEEPLWQHIRKVMGNISGKSILDLGCGFGYESVLLAQDDARVTGIDLSYQSISKARELARRMGVIVDFRVGNIDYVEFESRFDIIFCKAILHHVPDTARTVQHCSRFLKADGLMIAQEPKSENLVAFIGRVTYPNLRTKTEHPFKTGELEKIFQDYYRSVYTRYFCVLSPLTFGLHLVKPLREKEELKRVCFSVLNSIDLKLLSIPCIPKYAWIEVVHGTND